MKASEILSQVNKTLTLLDRNSKPVSIGLSGGKVAIGSNNDFAVLDDKTALDVANSLQSWATQNGEGWVEADLGGLIVLEREQVLQIASHLLRLLAEKHGVILSEKL